jgi:hypothetical protein
MVDDDSAIDEPGDGEVDFAQTEEGDEILEDAFPERQGDVTVVSWHVTEEIEYRLFFGRLFPRWGIASWELLTLNRGGVIAQATYNDRPPVFTRDGLIAWLMGSGVDAGAATQLTDLAVEARDDLFLEERPAGSGWRAQEDLNPRPSDP